MISVAVSRLWSMSLQAGILILVVLAARFFLKKYPKIYVYSLWALVGMRLLCPIFVETPFSLQPEAVHPQGIVQNGKLFADREAAPQGQQPDSHGIQNENFENESTGGSAGLSNMGTGMGENGISPETPQKDVDLKGMENPSSADNILMNTSIRTANTVSALFDPSGVLSLLVIVYLAGVAVFFCFYLAQYGILKYRISTAVKGKGKVWFSENIDSPFVIGIFAPRIIVPYGLKKQEAYHILKHERTHIKHHDPLIRLAGTLCICLHWWNPLVWLAVSKMNQDMEMFCDEAVLRNASAEERKSYARTLLSFAERRSGLSIGLAFGESHTERRVRNLMRKRRGGILVTGLVTVLTIFCMAAFMTIPGVDAEGMGNPDGSGTQAGSGNGNDAGGSTQAGGGNSNGTGGGTQAGGGNSNGTGDDTQAGGGNNSGTGGGTQNLPGAADGNITLTQNISDGMIEGQSFDVEWNPHGHVTFAAYAPGTALNPYEDVTFKLLQGGQVIYTFDRANGQQDDRVFQNVEAVAFPDLNGDNYTDMIAIINYRQGDNSFSEALIYTGGENGSFVEEIYLEEAYSESHTQKTVAEIKVFAAQPENQDYFVRNFTIYGTWNVTEHIPPMGIYALSEEQIKSYEGTQLLYGASWYRQGSGDAQAVENYRKELVTAREFEDDFRTDTGAMGLSTTAFTYFELEGVPASASLFGQFFYQIDADNALIYYEGVFFRAVRE